MFHLDVAKVDIDVAFVAMATHVCCKCMFQMLHLFQTYVTNISPGCCKSRSRCCKNRFRCCIFLQLLHTYVASVCSKYFIYFRRILQVFHLGVAKIDLDVAFVAMATHVCCICTFQIFHLFQMYVTSVSSRCCKSSSGCSFVAMDVNVCCKCIF
jgi:hypothetical protein